MSESAEPVHVGLTFDEYLAFEERSELRHEFVRGVVHAMSGAVYRHHRIVGNVARALDAIYDGAEVPARALRRLKEPPAPVGRAPLTPSAAARPGAPAARPRPRRG